MVGERRGRLVHHDHAPGLDNRACDFDQLAISRAQPPDARPRVNLETEVDEHRAGAPLQFAVVDEANRRQLQWLAPEEDVFGHGQMRRQRQFLVDHRYPADERVSRARESAPRAVRLTAAGTVLPANDFVMPRISSAGAWLVITKDVHKDAQSFTKKPESIFVGLRVALWTIST